MSVPQAAFLAQRNVMVGYSLFGPTVVQMHWGMLQVQCTSAAPLATMLHLRLHKLMRV